MCVCRRERGEGERGSSRERGVAVLARGGRGGGHQRLLLGVLHSSDDGDGHRPRLASASARQFRRKHTRGSSRAGGHLQNNTHAQRKRDVRCAFPERDSRTNDPRLSPREERQRQRQRQTKRERERDQREAPTKRYFDTHTLNYVLGKARDRTSPVKLGGSKRNRFFSKGRE